MANGGYSLVAVRRLPTEVASLLQSTGCRCTGFTSCGAWAPEHAGSVVVVRGFSCPSACGIFPDQGLHPRPLHWQNDSLPLSHQGSPVYYLQLKLLLCTDGNTQYSTHNIHTEYSSYNVQYRRLKIPHLIHQTQHTTFNTGYSSLRVSPGL